MRSCGLCPGGVWAVLGPQLCRASPASLPACGLARLHARPLVPLSCWVAPVAAVPAWSWHGSSAYTAARAPLAAGSAPDPDRDMAIALLNGLSAKSRTAPLKALFKVLEERQAKSQDPRDERLLSVGCVVWVSVVCVVWVSAVWVVWVPAVCVALRACVCGQMCGVCSV